MPLLRPSSRPIAVITGASAGIGREFARQLSATHDLVLIARDRARLEALAAALTADRGARCEVVAADLTIDEDVTAVVRRLEAAVPDLLVHNAGFGTRGSLARATRESQEAMVRLHVLATTRLTQAVLPGMLGRGGGAIVIVSSVASYLTSPGNVNYCATKAYQRIFCEGLALEVSGRGVYVQALCPGFTHTEFHERGGLDKTRYPRWVWLAAERVVRDSLRALARRRPVVVIPGLGYRAVVLLLRCLPAWAIRRLASGYRRDRAPAPGRKT